MKLDAKLFSALGEICCLQDKDHAYIKRVRDKERCALKAYASTYTRLLCLEKVRKKVCSKEWKLV